VAKVEAVEAAAEADLEVGAVNDPTAPDVMDSTLRDKMKGGLVCIYMELNLWLQHDVEQSSDRILNWISEEVAETVDQMELL